MLFKTEYFSKLGKLILLSEKEKLTNIFFENQKNHSNLGNYKENNNLLIFEKTKKWLDDYFKNKNPKTNDILIDLKGTDFQKEVWNILRLIPYSKLVTYGDIKKILEEKLNRKFACQAIGNAISKNPILIIVPCHRVIAKTLKLTGFSAGIETKAELLKLEGLKEGKDFIY